MAVNGRAQPMLAFYTLRFSKHSTRAEGNVLIDPILSRRATQTDLRRREGFISAHISKKNPSPLSWPFSVLPYQFFSLPSYYKPDIHIRSKNVHLWTCLKKKNAAQTIIRKSCADFAVCVCVCVCVTLSVPFSLIHVSPQARSKVSVTVTGDQTIFVRLGAEPFTVSHPSQMLPQFCIKRAIGKPSCKVFHMVVLWMFSRSCYPDSQMAHEPIHRCCMSFNRSFFFSFFMTF